MLDPILTLSFSMHSHRGVYAVLLGSGVSRAASIPTGWEIVTDLIQKLAALMGEACDPTAEEWYRRKFEEDPAYGQLLKRLGRSPAERQQLLRSYFEPTAAEAQASIKQPTKAHKALAALVKSGHIRVIVTTNFDRLVERSLEAEGVNPIVISSPAAVDGALPLTHAACTVIKLHGDYLDARIKNTVDELARYDRKTDRLLDRILDEFGLIVCGWSADWDEALRRAFQRCKSRRFSTFWTVRGSTSDGARRLIDHRAAETITIVDADGFFQDLHQKIVALTSFDPPHPLSAKTAVATMKRLLVDDRHRIELHDLVTTEVQRVIEAISDVNMPVSGTIPVNSAEVTKRVRKYDSLVTILCDLLITGCYWGDSTHHELWIDTLQRLANRPRSGGMTFWLDLRRYPAVRVLYAAGIAATLRSRYDTLRALFLRAKVTTDHEVGTEAVNGLLLETVLETRAVRQFFEGMNNLKTAANDLLFGSLRDSFRDLLPDEGDFADAFDRFEYLLALVVAQHGGFVPVGRFGWRGGRHQPGRKVIKRIAAEVEAGQESPLITSGLFESSTKLTEAQARVSEAISRTGWTW